MAKKRGDNERAVDGLGLLMGAFDWEEAMKYAEFKFSDVAEVILAREGEPDGAHWHLIVRLKSGKFGWLNAWCDYSGWGCQEGGKSGVCDTADEARERLVNVYEYETDRRDGE